MNQPARLCLALGCSLALLSGKASAESEFATLECHGAARLLAPEAFPSGRQYAPDREVQMLHLALDVTPDFQQRTVSGQATLRFQPLLLPLKELRLDAVDLRVARLTGSEKIQAYQVTDQQIIVTFAEPVPVGRATTLTIEYQAEPVKGLYFRTPEMGYPEGDAHCFSQGEMIEARHWYPCLDSPNHLFTSEVTCRVPQGMTVISNGRLVSETKDAANGRVAFHWTQEKPHVNYLITLCAGYFKKIEDRHKDVPLAFYTPASRIAYAANSFAGTKEMMAFFEQETGVPYPWAKYDQVCVYDFVAGGMENTSATTLNESTLFASDTENLSSSEGLVAHELAHQWFGDLVTCKDWSHTWLNEGFATYYESLYTEHRHGRAEMIHELYHRTRQITGLSNDTNAIVRRTYSDPGEMFGTLAYPKGSWVLHMLRSQLGPELYRRCVKTYLERHRHGNVTTEDFRKVIEDLTGRSHDQFFDQWVYHAHFPEIEASYAWDETAKMARLSIRQVQRLGNNVLLFNFPLLIRFKSDAGTVDRLIQVTQAAEDFAFTLDAMPQLVRLDPEYTLLARVSFPIPNAMLTRQLTDPDDVAGRLLAIEQLTNRKDKETIARLKRALNEDPFYGVRVEAARALAAIHSEDALEALLASTSQTDARVRQRVVDGIGDFYRETAYAAMRQVAEREKNPDILADAIRSLGNYAKPETRETLLKFLETDSFRNTLANAAIGAMRSQDDPAYLGPLLATLPKQEKAFSSWGFAQALGTLGYLARNEEKKEAVREFLVRHVNSKRRGVPVAAISALGTLGDPKAIGVLETFTAAPRDSRERAAAIRAVADLRAARRPVDDFKNLRQEVLDLQKSSRDLRKELDDLKKQMQSRESTPAKPGPTPATPSAPDKRKKKTTTAAPPKPAP